MNALVPQSSAAFPAIAPELPRLPPNIHHAVAVALNPVIGKGHSGKDDPGHRTTPPALTLAEWEEAQRLADKIQAMMAPVTMPVLRSWLTSVNLACRNPQTPQQFALRLGHLAAILGDLPAAAFTLEAMRKLDTPFFPAAHDVRSAVYPIAQEWQRVQSALRRLPRPKVTEGPDGSVVTRTRHESAEERAKHAAQDRATIAEMKARLVQQGQRPMRKPKEAHLTATQRVKWYRAAGQMNVAAHIAAANGGVEDD